MPSRKRRKRHPAQYAHARKVHNVTEQPFRRTPIWDDEFAERWQRIGGRSQLEFDDEEQGVRDESA